MNIGMDVQFVSGWEYFSKKTMDCNGNHYVGRIVSNVQFSESQSPDRTYESDIISVSLNNNDYYFSKKMADYSDYAIGNISVIFRKPDGTILKSTKVQQFSFGIGGDPPGHIFKVQCSNAIDMNKDITQKIDTDTWANAHDSAIGQVVPMVYNTVARIKAWKIDDRINQADWLLGKAEISTITKVSIGGIDPVNSSYYSLGNDGTYWWVNMGHGNLYDRGNYCLVDVTTPTYTPVEIITDMLDGTVTVAANTAFKTWLSNQGYTAAKCRYYLRESMSASQLLQKFCESFECNWRLNSSNEVEFTHIDPDNISTTYEFEPGEIASVNVSQDYQPKLIKNEITYFYDLNYETNDYNEQAVYDGGNQGDVGIFQDSVNFEFLTESGQAEETAKQRYLQHKEPPNEIRVQIPTTTNVAIDTIDTGDLVRVRCPDLQEPNPMLFKVLRKNADTDNNVINIDLENKNFMGPTWYINHGEGHLVWWADQRIKI